MPVPPSMPNGSPHLDDAEVAELVEGRVSLERSAATAAHLAGCEACRRLVSAAASAGETPLEERNTQRIGRYEVLSVLGAGGTAVVYLARDPDLDRKVALKVLVPTALGPNAEAHELLVHEARAMARLSHPNLVTVHEVGRADRHTFLAMEYLEGTTLAGWLRERARTWPELRDVFLEAGKGLAAAHAAGLLHGDFKPTNVLVGADGRVCVSDFGFAAQLAGDASPSGGTPAYMAPEQRLRGQKVDERADQYAFCKALEESLALSAVTAVPRGVQATLARGLSPSPLARFHSMTELMAELEPPRPWRTRRRWMVAALGGAAVALSLGAWAAFLRPPRLVSIDGNSTVIRPLKKCRWSGPPSCGPDEVCRFGGVPCGADGSTGYCWRRPAQCPQDSQPACGCDGKDYPGKCQALAVGMPLSHLEACSSH